MSSQRSLALVFCLGVLTVSGCTFDPPGLPVSRDAGVTDMDVADMPDPEDLGADAGRDMAPGDMPTDLPDMVIADMPADMSQDQGVGDMGIEDMGVGDMATDMPVVDMSVGQDMGADLGDMSSVDMADPDMGALVDECQTGAHTCTGLATCQDEVVGYTCVCPTGYRWDGADCEDVNECADLAAPPCDPLATCANTSGGYTCTCPLGTQGDGQTCGYFGSCADLKAMWPGAPSGDYTVVTTAGAVTAYCDMTSEGGRGLTLLRVDDPSLTSAQAPYAAACAQYGMEIVAPRTQAMMDAIIAWNGAPPNIVNVVPLNANARALDQWTGLCQGQTCGFFVTDRTGSSQCKTLAGARTEADPGTWFDGTHAPSCEAYRVRSGTTAQDGVYRIDPDGSGNGVAAFDVWCDQGRDGGGWTHVATTSDDGVSTWTWNRRDLWQNDTSIVGTLAQRHLDYKNPGVHHAPFHDVMFLHKPSDVWASYHSVGDGSRAIGPHIAAQPSPQCDPNTGHAMSAGTLAASGGLCSTKLYFNAGDYDGERWRCDTLFGMNDESTFGPSWSRNRNSGCPFDDPARSGWGPSYESGDAERDGQGFGDALGLNTGANDSGQNNLQLYTRAPYPSEPSGQNATTDRLVLAETPTGTAGADCPYGSWEDRGDAVVLQGYVLCSYND